MPLQLRSLIRPDATLEVTLAEVPMPVATHDDEVVVRLEAAPLNPSDMGLLFGSADLSSATLCGTAERPVLTARVPAAAMAALAGRVGQSLPVGNEGAGTVVAAGASAAAQALLGRKVAVLGGAMYAEYRALPAEQCLPLPEGTTAAEGASCFVNPMTALGMVETMRREGHHALVHTAAASNLGQMLQRICRAEGIGLVNIVRNEQQVALLRGQGAQHVLNSRAPGFTDALVEAIAATGATLAFDAIGGGALASQILNAMDAALLRQSGEPYSRYGSTTHKQVYLYGSLDRGPVELTRGFGMHWGVGGWLVFHYLQKVGTQRVQQLQQRVVDELRTTFASHYSCEFGLAEMLTPQAIAVYSRMATGEKALLRIAAG